MLGRLLSLIQCWPNADILFANLITLLAYSKCTKKFQWTEDTLVVVQLVKKFTARLEPTSHKIYSHLFHILYHIQVTATCFGATHIRFLSQIYPARTLPRPSVESSFNNIISCTPTCCKWSLGCSMYDQKCVCVYLKSHACYISLQA